MPNYSATGLVLHRLNLGENDKILTLYTREHGKLSAVAKGARKGKSPISGATELFTKSRLLLATGRSLEVIAQCEIADSYPRLRGDLERLTRATYLCELLDGLSLERDSSASAEIFDLTSAALSLMQEEAAWLDAPLHAWELRLLSLLGYAPTLQACAKCGEPLSGKGAGFSPSLGGVLCAADRYRADDAFAITQDTLTTLQTLQTARTRELLALRPLVRTIAEVDRALRWFLRFRSERPIKSADFLDSLRAAT